MHPALTSPAGLALVRSFATWTSALVLGLLPIVVAMDYGGVLRWTHYLIAIAALAATIAALPSVTEWSGSDPWRRHRLLLPLLLWVAYAWLQTVPLPAVLVHVLSPASAKAYTDWLAPYLEPSQRPTYFPISLAAFDSRHVAAMLLVLVAVAWSAAQVFQSRARIGWLLCLIAVGASIHVLIGIWRLVFPDTAAWTAMAESGGQTFGAFVNRNNAALYFNFGLAASLGLLSWRLTAMTGLEVDDPSFEFNDLFSLINDRESVVGVAGAAVCLTGLLICGSRGGIVAALAGGLLAFGWVRQRRGYISLPVVGAVIAVAAACLIIPFNVDLESIRRFEWSAETDSTTIIRDGRLQHWRDGMDAAISHLPAGSGLSTYAYAHLPFKQTGPYAWYHHADNLWLELITEQGIVGLALAILVFVFVVQSLNHLGLSHDPLDQGLRTCGWYSVGAVVVSQSFDFGLIIPANLLVATTLLATIIARDAMTRVPASPETQKVVWRSHRQEIAGAALAVMTVASVLLSLPVLRRDAQVESAVRTVQSRFDEIQLDASKLGQAAEELTQLPGSHLNPHVTALLSDIDYRIARITEVMESRPKSLEEMRDLYAKTGSVPRRLQWRQATPDSDADLRPNLLAEPKSLEFYRRALNEAGLTLRALPLDSLARTKFIYLDFIHRDRQLSSTAIVQLRQFFRNNPPMLMRLAVFAADSNETETAVEMWRSAIEQDPVFTGQAIEQALKRGELEFSEVVPRRPTNLREAAKFLLARGIENDPFLVEALAGIDCDSAARLTERAACEQLAGDIQFKLGQFDDAFSSYRSAIERTPADTELRLKLVRRLRDQGRNRESLGEAQLARLLFPTDGRFDAIIKAMAELDLQEVESRNE